MQSSRKGLGHVDPGGLQGRLGALGDQTQDQLPCPSLDFMFCSHDVIALCIVLMFVFLMQLCVVGLLKCRRVVVCVVVFEGFGVVLF